MTTPVEAIMGILIGSIVIGAIIGLVLYVIQAYAIWKISKSRGYAYAWLAFIPVAQSYVLGGIADNISVCYGRRSSLRIWMLILNIISFLSGIITSVISIQRTQYMFRMLLYSLESSRPLAPNVLWNMLGTSLASSAVVSLIGLALMIFTYIALYRIYRDYTRSAVAFLVLSILFSVTVPFFLLSLRNKPSASLQYRAGFYGAGSYPGGTPNPRAPYAASNAQAPYAAPNARAPYAAPNAQAPYAAPNAQAPYAAPNAQAPYAAPNPQAPYAAPSPQAPYAAPSPQAPYAAPNAQAPSAASTAQQSLEGPSSGT